MRFGDRNEWINAVNKDPTVLHERGILTLVTRPQGPNLFSNKYFFNINGHHDGTIDR